jgi:putative ABC transport system permease protein
VIAQFAFVNFADARRIFGVADVVNYGMVILDENANVTAVKHDLEELNPRLQVYTAGEFAESIRKEVNDTFLPIILILVFIGFIVGSAVVGLTIYTATIERAGEFGVMKAAGASSGFLYRIVLSQSALLTTAGFGFGLIAALITADLAERAVPEFATQFQPLDVAAILGVAAGMGVVASLVPVRRINSIDPAAVFRA